MSSCMWRGVRAATVCAPRSSCGPERQRSSPPSQPPSPLTAAFTVLKGSKYVHLFLLNPK